MLEHSCLHVTCWVQATSADAPSAWLRRVTDAAAHPLGFVRFAGQARRSWFSWLSRTRLDVYETEDASHLMSLVRPCGLMRYWDVYDAEDRHVGRIQPPRLLDSDGQRRALLDVRDGAQGFIRDAHDHVLASFSRKRTLELEVNFEPEADANPFLRMLLLGGILALDAGPLA